MLIEWRDAYDAELAALVTAQQRETGVARFVPDGDATYVVAVVDGRAVACGSWHPLPDGTAELDRMYVRPPYRNRGIDQQLIVALEEDALAAGRSAVRHGELVG